MFQVVAGSTILLDGAGSAAQQAIFQTGPIQATFEVYQDFMQYKTGIYQHVSGELLGKHSIKVVGFGVDGGIPYWTVANSWGPNWGNLVHPITKKWQLFALIFAFVLRYARLL